MRLTFDQMGHFQVSEVLGNGLLGNGEWFRELVYCRRAAGEPVYDCAPGWIGEGGENVAETIHNHMVLNMRGHVNLSTDDHGKA